MKGNIYNQGQLAAPGGIVEESDCGYEGTDLVAGYWKAALRELQQETGMEIERGQVFYNIQECKSNYEGKIHRAYAIFYTGLKKPIVPGPEREHEHEVHSSQLINVEGTQADDHRFVWADIEPLMTRNDLIPTSSEALWRLQGYVNSIKNYLHAHPEVEQEVLPDQAVLSRATRHITFTGV